MYGLKLEDLREENDLKKKDIAKYLGIVESVYSEFENGKLTIPTKRLYQLANFYKINIDYLIGITNKRIIINDINKIDLIIIGKRIREIRNKLNLTMRELAQIFDCSSSVISNYENGKHLIMSPFLFELCKISNTSIDWILGRSNNPKI